MTMSLKEAQELFRNPIWNRETSEWEECEGCFNSVDAYCASLKEEATEIEEELGLRNLSDWEKWKPSRNDFWRVEPSKIYIAYLKDKAPGFAKKQAQNLIPFTIRAQMINNYRRYLKKTRTA